MERIDGCRKTLFTHMAEGTLDDTAIARKGAKLDYRQADYRQARIRPWSRSHTSSGSSCGIRGSK